MLFLEKVIVVFLKNNIPTGGPRAFGVLRTISGSGEIAKNILIVLLNWNSVLWKLKNSGSKNKLSSGLLQIGVENFLIVF